MALHGGNAVGLLAGDRGGSVEVGDGLGGGDWQQFCAEDLQHSTASDRTDGARVGDENQIQAAHEVAGASEALDEAGGGAGRREGKAHDLLRGAHWCEGRWTQGVESVACVAIDDVNGLRLAVNEQRVPCVIPVVRNGGGREGFAL
jgi:hypothetical protein